MIDNKNGVELVPCPECIGAGIIYDGKDFIPCIMCESTGQVEYSEDEDVSDDGFIEE